VVLQLKKQNINAELLLLSAQLSTITILIAYLLLSQSALSWIGHTGSRRRLNKITMQRSCH